jgi:hypothetical protein
MPRLATAALAAIALAATAFPAHALWPEGGLAVSDHPNLPAPIGVFDDDSGGNYSVWSHYQDFGDDVFIQRFGADGQPAPGWPYGGLTVAGSLSRVSSAGAVRGPGGAVWIVWGDIRSGYSQDLYFQLVYPDGSLGFGPHGQVLSAGSGDEYLKKVVADGFGGFYAIWEVAIDGEIRAQHVDAAGDRVGPDPYGQFVAPVYGGLGGVNAALGYYLYVTWTDTRSPGNRGIYLQRLEYGAGLTLFSPFDGFTVCEAGGERVLPAMTTEGLGGDVVLAWEDLRNDANGLLFAETYAQRYYPWAVPQWAADGALVFEQHWAVTYQPGLAGDGTGGVYVAMATRDTTPGVPGLIGRAVIRAKRLDASGAPAYGWPFNGRLLGGPFDYSGSLPVLGATTSDGAGGLYTTWRDPIDGHSLRAARLRPTGAFATGWAAGGTPFASPPSGAVTLPTATVDSQGGLMLAWSDQSSGPGRHLLQRFYPNGLTYSFDALPYGAYDIPNDEGGALRIGVIAAPADAGGGTPAVTGYNVWRLLDDWPAAAQAGSPPAAPASRPEDAEGLQVRAEGLLSRARDERVVLPPDEAQALGFPAGFWESLGFHAATGNYEYAFTVQTKKDVGPLGPALETYCLSVHTESARSYTVSATVQGASADNLAPATPQGLTGGGGAGGFSLVWTPNTERDLAGYAVHRGPDPGFAPSPANRIGSPAGAVFTDPAPVPGVYYKVSALDRHGNESPHAGLQGMVDANAGPAADFLGPPVPNPFGARTTIAFGLARAGRVSVQVFDLGGRLVRTLAWGDRAAGPHSLVWDGDDDHGSPLPRGLYMVKLVAPGIERSRKVALLR